MLSFKFGLAHYRWVKYAFNYNMWLFYCTYPLESPASVRDSSMALDSDSGELYKKNSFNEGYITYDNKTHSTNTLTCAYARRSDKLSGYSISMFHKKSANKKLKYRYFRVLPLVFDLRYQSNTTIFNYRNNIYQ